MADASDRAPPSEGGLRGWLSEVYWTALASGRLEALARRLGDRASVDDPSFGRAQGMPAVDELLREAASWIASHEGAFEPMAFTMGSDRDVTEGSLSLRLEGRSVKLPVAVVAERRREREVELRVYYSAKLLRGARRERGALVAEDHVPLPPILGQYFEALARGDVAGLVATFERGGCLRTAEGETPSNDDGRLRRYFEDLFSRAAARDDGGQRGIELSPGGRADDGRSCAVEYTRVAVGGRRVPSGAGLAVYERGETGLLRAVRLYDDPI